MKKRTDAIAAAVLSLLVYGSLLLTGCSSFGGNARDKLKDYSGAISDYNNAIEINPKDENAYFSRGNIRIKSVLKLKQQVLLNQHASAFI